jgi:hypothetical protein
VAADVIGVIVKEFGIPLSLSLSRMNATTSHLK